MIRTILFFIVMYLLIKVISRFFLQPGNAQNRKGGNSFFYEVFRQYQQGQQQDGRQQSQQKKGGDRFEEIEEAEYEDITDEDNSTSKSSD